MHLDRVLFSAALAAAVAGCGEPGVSSSETRPSALAPALAASADTFINSYVPDNNNGTSLSVYLGENGQKGLMRTLVRFQVPAAWQGHVTVTRAVLTMTTRGTGATETTPPTPATASLQAITVPWTEGPGFGDGPTSNTVGQACGTSGATWNQPDCAGGTPWTGGTVSSTVSGTASVPDALEAAVTWDSSTAGNAGMVADVQAWIDTPGTNQGWRISSSTEGSAGEAQRFYSREAAGKGPVLTITAACTGGLAESDGGCAPPSAGAPDASAADAGGGGGGGGGCSCEWSGGRPTRTSALLASLILVVVVRSRRRPRGVSRC